jgi:hypothetical protein
MNTPTTLRQLLQAGPMLVAPGWLGVNWSGGLSWGIM